MFPFRDRKLFAVAETITSGARTSGIDMGLVLRLIEAAPGGVANLVWAAMDVPALDVGRDLRSFREEEQRQLTFIGRGI